MLTQVERRALPLESLITERAAMEAVIASGRRSETPHEPIWVKARADMPGMWEIADGHHRVAEVLRVGGTTIEADCDPMPDDEPYSPPFYQFRNPERETPT